MGLSLEREMGAIFVVFGFPPLLFSREVSFMSEVPSLIELLGICLVAALYLAVHFGGIREVCGDERC
jgi:hypothetical protein